MKMLSTCRELLPLSIIYTRLANSSAFSYNNHCLGSSIRCNIHPRFRKFSSFMITGMNHHHFHSSDSSDTESISSAKSDDDHKRIRLPVLKYGYRTEPLEWEELVDIITIQNDLAKLSRSIEQQKAYEIYKRDLLKHWKSVIDHVLCDKFPQVFQSKTCPETSLWHAHPSIPDATSSGIEESVLVRNDFPYYMADGLEHWILWKLGPPITERDIEKAKSQLQNERFRPHHLLHWINPPHLKSLPQIDHVHFIGKLKQTDGKTES